MPQPIAYLSFNGNCAEAMQFYEKALGGKISVEIRNRDTPFAGQCPPELLDRVMHARLELEGNGQIYGGDCPPHIPFEAFKGLMLVLNYDTVAQAETVFAALSAGGKIVMPLQQTFWAKIYGNCIDKFGISWGVNGELTPM